MIEIDGSRGEGGGQVLRSAVGLALATGTPVKVDGIRARRSRPGILRQHLTAVRAATEIGDAEVEGADIGSRSLVFRPRGVRPGSYHFAIGTAGSTTLVLQTVLPALMCAKGPSELVLEGGTHNPAAPPFEFLARCFLPLLARMGPRVEAILERHGFYPAGGGRLRVRIDPCARLEPIALEERGAVRARRVHVILSNLRGSIMNREIQAALGVLGWSAGGAGPGEPAEVRRQGLRDQPGPGNVIHIEVESEHLTEVFTGFGERGVTAERVAGRTAGAVAAYLASGVPVGPHLADQLLLPLALAGGGRFRTTPPTPHTDTHAEVLERFLPVAIERREEREGAWRIEVRRAG